MTCERSYLLEAPREIRLLIYKAYIAPDGVLSYHYESGKLRNSNDEPVDLALMLTCKLIAFEMDGFALRENTITFTTYHSESLACWMARYNTSRYRLNDLRIGMLAGVTSSLIATNALEGIKPKFPWFAPTLEKVLATATSTRDRSHYEREFLIREDSPPTYPLRDDAVLYSLQLASAAGPLFRQEAFHALRRVTSRDRFGMRLERRVPVLNFPDPFQIINFEAHSWAIPDEELCIKIRSLVREVVGSQPGDEGHPPSGSRKGDSERVSAVAAAIRFLNALPEKCRAHLRKLHLIEDVNSGRWYESADAQGLIPFCKENSQLRFVRRVLLWNTIYTTGLSDGNDLGPEIIRWILDAAALPVSGMPTGSFSLVFDGQSAPDQATEVFQDFVHRDIAWAQAFDKWRVTHQHKSKRRLMSHTIAEQLPKLMADIAAGTSFIRCNFDPGQPRDFAQVYDKIKDITRYPAVELVYRTRPPYAFISRSPLPSRAELLKLRTGLLNWQAVPWGQFPIDDEERISYFDDDESLCSAFSDRSWPTEDEIVENEVLLEE